MNEKNKMIRIYTGTEISVISLKNKLEETGIYPLIKNDYKSGMAAGILVGTPSTIDLYIEQTDYKDAEPIIGEFIRNKNKTI
jgi:hypothetical protein